MEGSNFDKINDGTSKNRTRTWKTNKRGVLTSQKGVEKKSKN